MKFISRYPNYRVVLKSAVPGNRQTGEQGKPGRYVKFEYGVANVTDEEDIKMMMQHPGFGRDKNADFIPADEYEADKHLGFDRTGKAQEPGHNITKMDRGTPVAQNKRGGNAQKSNDGYSKEDVRKLAKEMAMEVLPDLVDKEIKRREGKQEDSGDTSQSDSSETTAENMGDVESELLAEDVNAKEEEPASEDVNVEKQEQEGKKTKSTKKSSSTSKKPPKKINK